MRALGPLAIAVILASPALARASEAAGDDASVFDPTRQDESPARRLASATAGGRYARLFATTMGGAALRWNNPYRLEHRLGATAESLSTTAPYGELAVGATLGGPDRWQHGAQLAFAAALSGVPQSMLTPSYVLLLRGPRRIWLRGRAGLPVVLSPDPNVGGELAAGVAWFFTGGVGLAADVVADGFYGAGTREVKAAFYPTLGAQAGLVVDLELLP